MVGKEIAMAKLFEPFKIGNLEIKNRIVMSPMCMFRATNKGKVADFHKVHYAARAIDRTGLIMLEATAVSTEGRITDSDLGIWSDEQIEGLKDIVKLIHQFGSSAGILLAHAGRKSRVSDNIPIAPSPIIFGDLRKPKEMNQEDIYHIQNDFADAAIRAKTAGFDVIEIHGAHGFLINEFLSPITNKRNDRFGGSLENRMSFLIEIIDNIKSSVDIPLFVRISATDWIEDGFDIDNSIRLSKELKKSGVALVDVSSGGITPDVNIFEIKKPGYNIEFSERIKKEANIATSAVGKITDALQAESILTENKADLIFMGRELLRNPYFSVDAQIKLGIKEIDIDHVYKRAYSI